MRERFHKSIVLPCLCCIAFYGGTQLVGETEAAFSSQVSPESITMSAAFVFPAAIKQLEDRAKKVSNNMNHHFKTIVAASPGASTEELHKKLAEVTAIEQELTLQLSTLRDIHDELSTYNVEIQNQGVTDVHTYDYVREGFQHVDRMLIDVQAAIDFQHIEAIRSSILLQIQELAETEKASKQYTQTNQDQENTENQDAAASNQETVTNSNHNEQVTAHDEETMENSE